MQKEKCCANCASAYEQKERPALLFCKLTGDIAPTWYLCPKHTWDTNLDATEKER